MSTVQCEPVCPGVRAVGCAPEAGSPPQCRLQPGGSHPASGGQSGHRTLPQALPKPQVLS